MQHSTNKTSKTRKPRSKQKYSAKQIRAFKLASTYEAELRKEGQANRDRLEWEAHVQRQARKNGVIAQATALPALNLTPADIAALQEFAEQCREQHRTRAA